MIVSGDGSFQAGDGTGAHDPVNPDDPVPGALSATRTTQDRRQIDATANADETPGTADLTAYPTIHRLQQGLSEDRYNKEFDLGLQHLLDRISATTGRDRS